MIQQYIEEFNRMPLAPQPWLNEIRKASLANFEKNGLPTQALEEWKDTNLSPITNAYFKMPREKSMALQNSLAFWSKFPHVVFHNGFCESISVKMDGVHVQKFGDAVTNSFQEFQPAFDLKPRYAHPFLDLNTSMVREGVAIHIEKNAELIEPIYLIYQSGQSKQAYHYRNMIVADAFSKSKIVEIFLSGESSGDCWTTPVTQILAKPNSSVEHIVMQKQSTLDFQTGLVLARLENHAHVSTTSFAFGGKITRNDIHFILDGEGASCEMNGLYAINGTQVVDHHTTVDHAKPHCTSFEKYKGVMNDQSHGIFEGKILVEKDAQKTDATQLNQNLLLSSQAKINTAPQLEILADDVKCAHGATIGKLDENQVFYLRSRGISLPDARQMLVVAYANEMIERVSIPEVRQELQECLSKKIGEI